MVDAEFAETRWTLVRRAGQNDASGEAALSDLCEIYYRPICGFFTRRSGSADAGRELAHAFFEELLARPAGLDADQAKGKFRGYLLGAAKHFLARKRVYENAQKRGGKVDHISFEEGESTSK